MANKNDDFSKRIKIRVENVRLSYPELFEATEYEDKWAYRASLIVCKKTQKDLIKKIQSSEKELIKEMGIDHEEESLKYMGLRDGDEDKPDKDGYENTMYLSSKRNKDKGRPTLVTRGRKEVESNDGLFYAGCYVNAIVEICLKKNAKKNQSLIFTELKAVQFFKDGDSFEGTIVKAHEFDEFDEFEDDDDDFN
jgi:hypothetical protein